MACLTNPIRQPSLDLSPIWILLISNEVSNRRQYLYDETDSSWDSIWFQSRVFRFYSTDGTSRRYSSQIFSPFLCIGAHALGFVSSVCSTNFYLLFYPSSTHVRALSQFLLCIFLLSPNELAWSQVIKQLCKSDSGSPVIEISSF
jgi:hypothetical protein